MTLPVIKLRLRIVAETRIGRRICYDLFRDTASSQTQQANCSHVCSC